MGINQNGYTVFGGSILTGSNTNGIALVLNGAGGLTLSGTSTTPGGAQVWNNGTLEITGSLTSAGVSVNDSATLYVLGGLTTTSDLRINDTAQLAGTGTINLAGGVGLYVSSSSAFTFAGTLTGTPGTQAVETCNGAHFTLTGTNNYGGQTLVDAGGTLTAGAVGTLSPNSSFIVNGLLDATGGSQTVASIAVGSSGALNLYIGNLLASTGTAGFAVGSTLNISGSIATLPEVLMTYSGPASGTFSNVNFDGSPLLGDRLAYSSGSLEIVSGPSVWASTVSGSWSTGAWTGAVPSGGWQGPCSAAQPTPP